MFLKGKKGQSALEYLMTYGWALVVIVIVVAALVFLINPSQVGAESCTGFSKMPITNFKFSTTGLQYEVTNETGRALTNVQFSATFTNGGSTTSVVDANTTIAANASSSVAFTGQSFAPGSVTADLTVVYSDGTYTRSITGTCRGAV